MAITYPVMALGLDFANPTFSIPGSAAGSAAGWAESRFAGTEGTIVGTGRFSDGPKPGHQRYQRYTMTPDATPTNATYRITSAPARRYKICGPSDTKLFGALHYRVSGLAGTSSVALWGIWYDSNTAILGSKLVNSVSANAATWTVNTAESTAYRVPVNADHIRLVIDVIYAQPSGPLVLDLAFAGIGCWDGESKGSYTWPSYPTHPGSGAYPTAEDVGYTDPMNADHHDDRDRYTQRFRGPLRRLGCLDSMKQALEYAWQMNHNRCDEIPTENPGGGRWPLLIVPGSPAFPAVGMFDIEGGAFQAQPAGDCFFDPPLWDVTLPLVEKVY